MNKIVFGHEQDRGSVELITKLIAAGLKIKKYDYPPKEFKSSPYRVWVNFDFDYGKVRFTFWFRDDDDYIMALLMK